MQFLEYSVIGLRAARHELASQTHAARVTLFPMVHVAEAAFYDRIMPDVLAHDVVLFEGVKSRRANVLTRVYRWLPFGRLGLVRQPTFGLSDGPARLVHADLSTDEFEALWRDLPLWQRVAAAVLTTVFGVWRRFTATRSGIARHMNQDDLPNRETVMAPGTPFEGWENAIRHARDARLRACLRAELSDLTAPKHVAVIYGAGHMPAVMNELTAIGGFRPVSSEWLEAIPL